MVWVLLRKVRNDLMTMEDLRSKDDHKKSIQTIYLY